MTTDKTTPVKLKIDRIQPAYQQVADQIRLLVVDGAVGPGERLPSETELTTMFGVSRSTIREAMRVLSTQGLIEARRGVNGGTFVTKLDAGDLREQIATTLSLLSSNSNITVDELLEARELLEVPAARLAADRVTPENIRVLGRCVEESVGTDQEPNHQCNHLFHSEILTASGNRVLEVTAQPVFMVLRSEFSTVGAPKEFWSTVRDQHLAILNSIEAQNADQAAEHMRSHLIYIKPMYRPRDQ